MRNRVLAGILSAAMVCSMTSGIVIPVDASAKTVNTAEQNSTISKWKDFLKKNLKAKSKEKYVEGDAIVVYKKDNTIRSKKAAKNVVFDMHKDIHVVGSYEFSDNVAKKSALRKTSFGSSQGFFVQKVHSDKLSTKELIAELEKDKAVAYAEPNYEIKTSGLTDDVYSDYQWSLQNKKLNNGIEDVDIQPEKEWAAAQTATKEAVIAIVDTGIDYTHEDLKDVMWQNPYKSSQLAGTYGYDFVNQDNDPMDEDGHGTHCAGIANASANNKKGISGISQGKVKLMALKCLGEEGGESFDFLGAYYYMLRAKKLGTNIIAANDSWGGISEMKIFNDVLELAGEEGIVSVMASGNEGYNLDKVYTSPNSKYVKNSVVVGASNEWDGMVEFSNYGAETVDMAAPGTDILSTVSYDCLNPTIYTEQQKNELLGSYYDGEKFHTDAMNSITVKDASGNDVTNQVMKTSSDTFFGKSGKSTMFDFKDAKKGDAYTISIPYKTGYSDTALYASMMLCQNGPEGYNEGKTINSLLDILSSNLVMITHSTLKYNKAQKKVYEDELDLLDILSMSGRENCWKHTAAQCISESDAKSGAVGGVFKFLVMITNDKKSCFYLDDLAVSKENINSSAFGKYDFYNGTSMSAPAVTGAVGLLYRQGDKPETVLSKIFSCVRKTDGWKDKCRTGGVLDLSKSEGYVPVIRRAVENDKSQTVLSGYNFGNDKGTIKIDGAVLPAEKILSWSDEQVTVDLADYRYKTVSIELTNAKNYSVSSKYCLKNTKDKLKKITDVKDFIENMPSFMTDGKNMYLFVDGVLKTLSAKTGEVKSIFSFEPAVFNSYLNDYDKSRVQIKYCSGAVYGADSVWALAKVSNTYRDITVLLRYNLKTKKVTTTQVTEGVGDAINNPVMAFYKNSIYLLGGVDDNYNEMKQVLRYDISAQKWEKKTDMPVAFAEGNTVVNGGKLYLCGSIAGNDAKSVILSFDGTTWKQLSGSSDTLKNSVFGRCNAMGVSKDKLILIGDGSEGFGSVMAYNLKTDKLEATGYSTGLPCDAWAAGSVTLGNTCYFMIADVENQIVAEDNTMRCVGLYSIPVEGVSNPATAEKKDVKVKKITINTTTKKKTVRYGEKLSLKAVVTPKNATKKDVTWTVDKKGYASVSAKGVLTPKKAGVGKSVVVKATAKDGSKVSAKIKIAILAKKSSK